MITRDDASLASHGHYKGLAVGGTLADATPSQSGTVSGYSWVRRLRYDARFEFKGGVRWGEGIPFDWAQFEYLASTAFGGYTSAGFRVIVEDQGGVYGDRATRWYSAPPGTGGEDNGRTLVVFRGKGTVVLTQTADGRQYGPSVLAPFAEVVIHGSLGYIDGFLVARSVRSIGQNGGSVQLHGDGYRGSLNCVVHCASPPAPPGNASDKVRARTFKKTVTPSWAPR